jgi:hypothetical protein
MPPSTPTHSPDSGSQSITPDHGRARCLRILHEAVITSYNDALVPIFTALIPAGGHRRHQSLFFTRQDKLKDTVE